MTDYLKGTTLVSFGNVSAAYEDGILAFFSSNDMPFWETIWLEQLPLTDKPFIHVSESSTYWRKENNYGSAPFKPDKYLSVVLSHLNIESSESEKLNDDKEIPFTKALKRLQKGKRVTFLNSDGLSYTTNGIASIENMALSELLKAKWFKNELNTEDLK